MVEISKVPYPFLWGSVASHQCDQGLLALHCDLTVGEQAKTTPTSDENDRTAPVYESVSWF